MLLPLAVRSHIDTHIDMQSLHIHSLHTSTNTFTPTHMYTHTQTTIQTQRDAANYRTPPQCAHSGVSPPPPPPSTFASPATLLSHPPLSVCLSVPSHRYCLLSRSSLRVSESQLGAGTPEAYATMSDELIMVHAAVELGRQVCVHVCVCGGGDFEEEWLRCVRVCLGPESMLTRSLRVRAYMFV